MWLIRLAASISTLAVAFLAGCSGGGNFSTTRPPPAGTIPVSLSMTDTAPVGVTLLSFQVTVTGAVLNSDSSNVSLVSTPIRIEITRLETETAFLSTRGVAPGTYNSLSLTFANAELTAKNDSGRDFSVCVNGAVCKLQPALNPSQLIISTPPFPLTVSANTPLGLLVDFNLSNVVQNDLTLNLGVASGVTVSTLAVQQPTGHLEDIDDVVGTVADKNVTNKQFTLQTAQSSLSIEVDNNTQFGDFNDVRCTANPQNFSCVADGQIVEVDARLLPAGTLLAKEVNLQDDVNQEQVEGIIVSIGAGTPPTQFRMVVVEKVRAVTTMQVGDLVTVTLQSAASFRVDNQGLTIPSDLVSSFQGPDDLLVGQSVQVRRRPGSSGTSVLTDRVRLRGSRITGKLDTKLNPTDFTVSNLPSLFANATPPIGTVEVRTSSQTIFKPTGMSVTRLKAGDRVSVRRLLFKRRLRTPVLLAKKVRKR